MKILLTGKNGQVGFALQRSLAALGEVVALGHAECDLADQAAIGGWIRKVKPDIIVNAAGYTDVDKAEAEIAKAMAVNARAPGVIGEEAARLGACVVHYSTDYVFDGTKTAPYAENDATNPLSVYGLSKRDGELALQASGARHLIFRTSWVVGAHGDNFARTILRLAAERDRLEVVADQIGAPTPAALLAESTAQLLRQMQREGSDGFAFGLYHLVPSGETTWHEYACFVLDAAARAGKTLKLKPRDVKAITTAEYPTAAKRPANSRLDTTLYRRTFGLELPSWQSGVQKILREILQNP
ncbi:MAG: dTDP-4-dehydrorhamnose reductase [Betaproteobacteria bacterium RIFCSPLOWO2_02_FULL_62_17]|nr:MAG: dTDP-4-dehydrorhamnose reductase [Betaproteobacteria bacterium RIFCSPLOWO2_02_FULL_62_17]